MPTKFPVARSSELLNPSLDGSLDAQRIISLVPVRPHELIGDIGAGPGALAIPFAKYTFDGKVFAIDVQKGMLELVGKRASELNLGNIELVVSTESKIPLEDGVLDGEILACVLNEATRPKSLLKESLRLLRKGGWAAVIEWHKRETEHGPPLKSRLSPEEIVEIAAGLGLRKESLRSVQDDRYLLLLRK